MFINEIKLESLFLMYKVIYHGNYRDFSPDRRDFSRIQKKKKFL